MREVLTETSNVNNTNHKKAEEELKLENGNEYTNSRGGIPS